MNLRIVRLVGRWETLYLMFGTLTNVYKIWLIIYYKNNLNIRSCAHAATQKKFIAYSDNKQICSTTWDYFSIDKQCSLFVKICLLKDPLDPVTHRSLSKKKNYNNRSGWSHCPAVTGPRTFPAYPIGASPFTADHWSCLVCSSADLGNAHNTNTCVWTMWW